MVYAIMLTPLMERQAAKLDPEIRRRFFKKIEKLKDEPRIYGKPLRGPLAGVWELKFENAFRILFLVKEVEKQVWVESIRHKDEF